MKFIGISLLSLKQAFNIGYKIMYQFHPLENEKHLEYLIRDILVLEYPNYNPFDLYGNRGQGQHGNDIIGYNQSGHMILAQVKKKSLSRHKIKEELLKDLEKEVKSIIYHFNKNKIDTIFFATTHGRDKDLQDKAVELTRQYGIKIVYWGWDTIEEKVSFSDEIQKKYFHKNKTVLLTSLPPNSYCIGREDEFSEINALFDIESIVNIQSIGGIGKSTLANSFIHKEKEKYDFIGYVSVEDSLEEAFFRNLNNFFTFSRNDDIEHIIYKLQSLNGNKLLIVDNLIYQKDIEYIQKLSSSFKIMITSRVLFNDVPSLKLKHLSNETLNDLFNKYHDDNIENTNLNELFEYLDYHTLFIELTAKTINRNSFTLDYILNEFRNGNFPTIKVDIDLDTYEEKIYNDYLKKLFEESIEKLNDGFFYGLRLLSLFPSISLHVDEINRVFGGDLSEELLLLSKKGWLIPIDQQTFKIHQIVKEFFLFNFPLSAENVAPMIEYYLVNVKWDEVEHPGRQKEYMIFIKSLIDSLKSYDEGVIILANNLAMLYRYFGFYELALKYMLIVKEFDEQKASNDEDNSNLAQTYNNLASIYAKLQDVEQAIEYFELSIDIRIKLNDPNLHEGILALGSLLVECGDAIAAEEYLNLLYKIEIDERALIPICNLGILVYTYLNKFPLAEEQMDIALNLIEQKVIDRQHLYVAYTYNNISFMYEILKNYRKALDYKIQQLEVMQNNFDEHPDAQLITSKIEYLKKKL